MTRPTTTDRGPRDRRSAVRAATATLGALGVLAGGVLAPSAGPLGGEAAATVARSPATRTVRVDPATCGLPPRDPALAVVCRPDQVPALLTDGGTVVVSGQRHAGALDLRGRSGLTVRGEPGAVLDAAGARYALSLRDVADVTVESLTLRGGTAQAAWVERTREVTLAGVTVERSAGSGVQVRDSARFVLSDSHVRDNASAGVMELTGVKASTYRGLVVTGNGRGAAAYNGDGLQLAGTGVQVRDSVVTGNGSSQLYEHGVYVSAAARSVVLDRVTAAGNSGVAVKLAGSGSLTRSVLVDDRVALYCGATAGAGWTVRATRLDAPREQARERGCTIRT